MTNHDALNSDAICWQHSKSANRISPCNFETPVNNCLKPLLKQLKGEPMCHFLCETEEWGLTGSVPAPGYLWMPWNTSLHLVGDERNWLLPYHSYSFPIGGGIGCQGWCCSSGLCGKGPCPKICNSDSSSPKHFRTQDKPGCCRIKKKEKFTRSMTRISLD